MTKPLFNIPLDAWDEQTSTVKGFYTNSRRLNALIATRFAEVEACVLDIERQKLELDAFEIRDLVSGKDADSQPEKKSEPKFLEYADRYIKVLEGRQSFNQRDADQSKLNVLRAYLWETDVPLKSIDKAFLLKLESHLRNVRGVKDKTIANYMMMVQAIFKVAIDEKALPKGSCPIGSEEGQYSIFVPRSMKMGLSMTDLKALYDYQPQTWGQQRALDVWFTSFFFAGMRAADVLRLRWSDFYDGRLHYRMGKNKKPGSVAIPEQVYSILARYEAEKRFSDDYVFPDLKKFYGENAPQAMTRRIKNAIFNYDRTINDRILPLLGIDRRAPIHVARHTFGRQAKRKGVSSIVLKELYRHSDLRTTEDYQKDFETDLADEALGQVVNF